MALLICKNNTGTNGDIDSYDPLSQGDNTDPLVAAVLLDGAGGTKESTVSQMYLVATLKKYTAIFVEVINDSSSIDWKLSLDNSTWTDSVSPSDMNALTTDQITSIYFKCVVLNDGSVGSQTFTTPKIRIEAVEASS